jgi:hypothetical protein
MEPNLAWFNLIDRANGALLNRPASAMHPVTFYMEISVSYTYGSSQFNIFLMSNFTSTDLNEKDNLIHLNSVNLRGNVGILPCLHACVALNVSEVIFQRDADLLHILE